jgi:hypothetical protein
MIIKKDQKVIRHVKDFLETAVKNDINRSKMDEGD